MTSKIGGKYWNISSQAGLKIPRLGECRYDSKTIKIPIEGDTRDELDTIVHECLHAACPYLEEDAVEHTATDIARLLWKLKWRKQDDFN